MIPPPATSVPTKGLEGIVATESAVCTVFGDEGRLIYRGYDIHDLADHSTFEETAYLLLNGELPTRAQLKTFTGQIKVSQKVDRVVHRVIKDAPVSADPMHVLRTAVSAAVFVDPDRGDGTRTAGDPKAVRVNAHRPPLPG